MLLSGQSFTAARGFAVLSLSDGPVLRAALGSVLYLALIGLLSLGVAVAVRDSGFAIGVVLGLLYLDIEATTGLHALPLSPWAGLGVLAAWAAGALLAGGLLFWQRDC